jgi:hypothetical protein
VARTDVAPFPIAVEALAEQAGAVARCVQPGRDGQPLATLCVARLEAAAGGALLSTSVICTSWPRRIDAARRAAERVVDVEVAEDHPWVDMRSGSAGRRAETYVAASRSSVRVKTMFGRVGTDAAVVAARAGQAVTTTGIVMAAADESDGETESSDQVRGVTTPEVASTLPSAPIASTA